MELKFLGTGAGVPAKERNVSSIALNLAAERGTTWLFDCGESTQHQILHTTIKPRKIEKIFITHLHGDHIFGLPGLLGSRSFQDGESTLTIYGPKGIKEFIEVTLMISQTHLKYPLDIIELNEGTIFEDDHFIVIAKKLDHGISSFGYRIIERDQPGPLLVDKLKEMGVSPGPLYKKIKNGERITLENGKVIDGKDFLGKKKPGRKVTILGDTRYCQQTLLLAQDADVLVHEATFSKDEEQLAYNYYHSTTVQAANVAKEARAKKLILTHISSRYQNERVDQLTQEAQDVFQNTTVAYDFYSYEVKKKDD